MNLWMGSTEAEKLEEKVELVYPTIKKREREKKKRDFNYKSYKSKEKEMNKA